MRRGPGRPANPVIPLNGEQQDFVCEWTSYVRAMAYRLWRWSHLPVRYLDDLKQDAAYALCVSVSKYKPSSNYTIEAWVILDVKGWLLKRIASYKQRLQCLADLHHELLQDPADNGFDTEECNQIAPLLNVLTDRQLQVIELTYGLAGGVPLSKPETAEILNIGLRSVSRIEQQGINRIRKNLKEMNNAAS